MTYRDYPIARPQCRRDLDRSEASERWVCGACAGQLWGEAEVIARLLEVAPDLRAEGGSRLPTLSRRTKDDPRPCPVCRDSMDPVFLGGIEVERCRVDELLWFDRDEIDRVVAIAKEQHGDRSGTWLARAWRALIA